MRTDKASTDYRNWKSGFEQQCWAQDVASYQRYANMLESARTEPMRTWCEKSMQRIRDKYPKVKWD